MVATQLSGSAATACYYYDADGKRVFRTGTAISDDCGTLGCGYVFNLEGRVIVSDNSTGTAVDVQAYAGDRHFGRQGGGAFFYHSDWLGTVRKIVSDQFLLNSAVQTCTSLPFGDGLTCNSNYSNVWHFTGKERDYESNLDFFGARFDASSLGRFMTPDPLGGHQEDPQTLNKYNYVRNNPLSLTDPTGLDSYLQCTPEKDPNGSPVASDTCQREVVGQDKNGKDQTTWVQGVTGDKGFTPTIIGNKDPNDPSSPLVDKTTGTGTYTASVNGRGVQFSNDAGQNFSTGVFINGTPQTTFRDAGWANGGALSNFIFTLENSKLEAGQTEAGVFSFAGTSDQARAALERAGLQHHSFGFNVGFAEYRSSGAPGTGANSAHFNVWITAHPGATVPVAGGNMHFGETNPFAGAAAAWQHLKEQQ